MGALDSLIFGYRVLFGDTDELPQRSKLSFGEGFAVTDDSVNKWTRVEVVGGGVSTADGTCTLEDFDAVGDGVADDTDAFEAASEAIADGTYQTLVLAAKTYLVNPTTVWPMGGSIVGQGPGSILATTQDRAIVLMYDSDSSDRAKSTLFANFRMVGSASGSLGAGAPANQNGIEIGYFGTDGAARVFMLNVQGYRLDRAFSVASSDELSIGPMGVNCQAEECKYGFYAATQSDWVNCQTIRCLTGLRVNGNVTWQGSIEFGTTGVHVAGGGNDGHGTFRGRIVHCTGSAINSPDALVNGFLFDNVQLFEGTISIANGNLGAVIFNGGQIDATAYDLNGKSRWHGVTFDTAYYSSSSFTNGENEFIDCRKRDMTIPSWLQTIVRKSYTFPSDANATLSSQDSWADVLSIQAGVIGAGRTLTSSRALSRGNKQLIKNQTAYTITFKWATGASVTIATGLSALVGANEYGACIDVMGSATGAEPTAGIDPTSIDFDGLWVPNFGGAPWAGTASAGSSSGRNMVSGAADPDVGTAVNTYTPADFESTNSDFLNVTATTAENFITTTAYTVMFLINPESAPVDTTVYNNPGLIVEGGGNWGVVYSSIAGTPKVSIYHASTLVASVAVPTGSWSHVVVRFGLVSGEMDIFVNGSNVSHTTSVAATGSVTGTALRMGRNFLTTYFDGKLMAMGTSQTAHSDVTIAGLYAFDKAKYPAMSLP